MFAIISIILSNFEEHAEHMYTHQPYNAHFQGYLCRGQADHSSKTNVEVILSATKKKL